MLYRLVPVALMSLFRRSVSAWVLMVMVICCACHELKALPEELLFDSDNKRDSETERDSEFDTENIMPNALGFSIKSEELELQGAWYWYDSGENSSVNKVYAYLDSDDFDNAPPYVWFEKESTEKNNNNYTDTRVARICAEGTTENKEGYIALGFELCSPTSGEGFFELPYPLGGCRLRPNGPDPVKDFKGVEFKINNISMDEFSRIDVQFKEWAEEDKCQPFCTVFSEKKQKNDLSLKDESQCTATWIDDEKKVIITADALSAKKSSLRDNDCGSDEERKLNLFMLQAIHVQVYRLSDDSDDSDDSNIEFCLSDMKAFKGTNTPDEQGGIKWPEKTDCGALPTDHAPEGFIEEKDWVQVNTNDGSFNIMKGEVTAEQYHQCVVAKACDAVRDWETCTVNRYEKGNDNEREEFAKRAANCISWCDAMNFCQWIDGELPKEEEWETAASMGPNHRPKGILGDSCNYIVMNDMDHGGVGCGEDRMPWETCKKNTEIKDRGETPPPLCDMAGNLWEWVNTTGDNPLEPNNKDKEEFYKKIKGGSLNTTGGNAFKVEYSSVEHITSPHSPTRVGFRCIRRP